MSFVPYPRVTPWVARLIAANAIVLLLLQTVFTSPAVSGALAFDPRAGLTHPWTFLSYMFVHEGLLHLLTNCLALWVFGTAVETRLGGRGFLLFYFYCGIGAAVFCWLLNLATPVAPFIGASGAVLGVAVAFAMLWPDAGIYIFPIPTPIKARVLVLGLIALDLLLARLTPGDNIAHLAHLGGAAAGFLYVRFQHLGPIEPEEPVRRAEPAMMAQTGAGAPERSAPVRRPTRPADGVEAEIDRVLDKISAQGLASLTASERRFLDEVSKRKRRD